MISDILPVILLIAVLYDIYVNLTLKKLMVKTEPEFTLQINQLKKFKELNDKNLREVIDTSKDTYEFIQRFYKVLEEAGLIKISDSEKGK